MTIEGTHRAPSGGGGHRPDALPRRARRDYVREAEEAETLRRGEMLACTVPELGQARNKTQRLRKRLAGMGRLESRYQGGVLFLQLRRWGHRPGDPLEAQAGDPGASRSV